VSSIDSPNWLATRPDWFSACAHVVHGALRLAGGRGEQVGDVRDLRAGQLELGHRAGRGLGGLADVHLAGGGERQRAAQAAVEDVGSGDAGLRQLGDRIGRPVALYWVSLPACSAALRSESMSLLLACVAALTADMDFSKSAADLTA
jgi:hypothetical protein